MAEFKVGDRVVLREDSKWDATENNPKQGSGFACEGTIIRIYGKCTFVVCWDNSWVNDEYTESDLGLIKPNKVLLSPIDLYRAIRHPYIRKRCAK